MKSFRSGPPSITDRHRLASVPTAAIIAILWLLGPVQPLVHAQDLPSGEEVMINHVAKTGGQAAYDKIENRVSESTLEILGQGVSLDLVTWSARPNKTLVKIDSDVTGKIEKGCDGEVVWENSLINGPIVHQGVQRESGLRDSVFERFVYWKDIYASAECVARGNVGDAECYEVVLTPRTKDAASGDAGLMRLFIDSTSYIIRKIQTVAETDAGKIEIVAFPKDYREVDGILIAHKVRLELLGQKRDVTVNSIQHNVDLPDNFFDLPEEVRQLVK